MGHPTVQDGAAAGPLLKISSGVRVRHNSATSESVFSTLLFINFLYFLPFIIIVTLFALCILLVAVLVIRRE